MIGAKTKKVEKHKIHLIIFKCMFETKTLTRFFLERYLRNMRDILILAREETDEKTKEKYLKAYHFFEERAQELALELK